jgi:hypothetical protein
MYTVDVNMIKIDKSHYFRYTGKVQNRFTYKGRMFFDKYERVDQTLTLQVMNLHSEGKEIIAHDLIRKDIRGEYVENIVFDYNGRDPERFWHRAQLMLREEGFLNFTAYKSKTEGHLHLYIHKGHTDLTEAYQLANLLSNKLSQRLPKQWKMFPSQDFPREFNILNLPYEMYQKERGSSWARHM